MLKPEYNILKIAGSSLGHKHSKETITKFKEIAQNKYYSDEEKARVSKLNLYRTEESRIKDKERILEINKKKGQMVEVLNTLTNELTILDSIRKAAEYINCAHISVLRVLKNKKLLRGIYKINYKNK